MAAFWARSKESSLSVFVGSNAAPLYEDGTVGEGVVTITRNVEIPEGMKPFLEYAQETENMRTVTIVSNPGTESEKIESVQVPKGLRVSLSSDWNIEKTMGVYIPMRHVLKHSKVIGMSTPTLLSI